MNEDRIIRQIDRRRENRIEASPLMKRAHDKAIREVLANPDYVIQEKDFKSVYGVANVADDVRTANHLAALFAKKQTARDKVTKQIAEVLEAIILMSAELGEWLGDARTLKTARYDDFKNKTDLIAEWFSPEEGSRILALAIDVTFGTISVEKKMLDIKNEIDSGTLGTIRYFRDERGDFMGTRNNVPRVVFGVSQGTVEELAGLWLGDKKKELGAHPVRHLLVAEMIVQLECMLTYAYAKDKNNAVIALQQALAVVKPLQQRTIEEPSDKVASSIMWHARAVFR